MRVESAQNKALNINAETLVETLFILYMLLSVNTVTAYQLWKGRSPSQFRLRLFSNDRTGTEGHHLGT